VRHYYSSEDALCLKFIPDAGGELHVFLPDQLKTYMIKIYLLMEVSASTHQGYSIKACNL
jgi:hypothetical protein